MEVKVINKSKNALPEYATIGAAGMDVRANLEDINENLLFDASLDFWNGTNNENPEGEWILTIQPGGRALVPTGLYTKIPEGYEIQVRSRSGLALKHGISLTNSIGTIDAN